MKHWLLLSLVLLCGLGLVDRLLEAPLDAQGNTATVTATPSALTFTWQIGTAIPVAQNVALKTTGTATTCTTATPSGDQWLVATPATCKVPGALSVQANPSTLPPGTYNSSVSVTLAGVLTPLVIPVVLTVTLPAANATVAPTTLAFTSGGTPAASVTIVNGPSSTTFTAASGSPWLSVLPSSGAVLPAQTQTLTITVNPASLVPQSAAYTGKVTVVTTTNGIARTQTVAVTLTVNALPPTIASVWPLQIPVGSPDTVVTIRGTNYYAATTVNVIGAPATLKATVLDSGAILATLPAALLATPGSLSLTVTNPAGGVSIPFVAFVGNTSGIAAITNAASYVQGAVSPGELIAIFGQNLGPAAAALLTVANGFATTNAGGVTVTIDGQSAPIIYAGASQVSVQVPYNVRLGTQAQGSARAVVLTFGNNPPAQTTVDVVASAPGIFTTNSTANGGVALVLNFDAATQSYSVNSITNPAKIGSTVVFFLTGEGDYASADYAVETGLVVPGTPPAPAGVYPQLNPLPTVAIGGAPSISVAYAGPIPTGILGLLQINAVVPANAAVGPTVPLGVAIGTTQTQPGLTMAVGP